MREKLSQNNSDQHVVILVNGIRTFAYWMSDIRPVLEENSYTVVPTGYGRFGLLKFLIPLPFFRRTVVTKVEKQIQHAVDRYKPKYVSIIAHSFGTYIICKIISQNPNICFRRIIFCGSVVDEHFDFMQYSGQIDGVILNEIGTKDIYPALAESISWGYGSIGTHGLNSHLVKNRWHDKLNHSDFLTPEFVQRYWIPFLQTGEAEGGALARPSLFSRLLSRIQLKYSVPAILITTYMLWNYIWIYPIAMPTNTFYCRNYDESNPEKWKSEHLKNMASGTYTIVVSEVKSSFPSVLFANIRGILDLHWFKNSFPNIDFELESINLDDTSRSTRRVIVMKKGRYGSEEACDVLRMASKCGIYYGGEPYMYKNGYGTRYDAQSCIRIKTDSK